MKYTERPHGDSIPISTISEVTRYVLSYYGKPRRLTLTSGTITIRRPRVRDLNERFVSRVLPLFKRQTKEVGDLPPQLYLLGLALGEFELALPGLLGEGAPLSPASLLRLKAQWQGEYDALSHICKTVPWARIQKRQNHIRL